MASLIMRVPEAAKLLGIPEAMIRRNIKKGIWTFGECIPKEKLGGRYDQYIIYRNKLEKWRGA